MAEYINREALEAHLNRRLKGLRAEYGGYDHYTDGYEEAVCTVEDFPAADVAPVVRGEWKELTNCSNSGVYCSVCHKKVYGGDYARSNKRNKIRSNFCPNCGALMQGSENRRVGKNVILGAYINVDMMDREDAKNELARQAGMCVEQYIRENDALIERDGTIGWRVEIYKEG